MLCYHGLKILNNFSFEFVFCKWSPMGAMVHAYEQKGYTQYGVLTVSCCPIPMSTESDRPTMYESSKKLKTGTEQVHYLHN